MEINKHKVEEYISQPALSQGAELAAPENVYLVLVDDTQIQAKVVTFQLYDLVVDLKTKPISGLCACNGFYKKTICRHIAAAFLAASNYKTGSFQNSEKLLAYIKSIEAAEKKQEQEDRIMLELKSKQAIMDMYTSLRKNYPKYLFEKFLRDIEAMQNSHDTNTEHSNVNETV
ncbi:hypothetical protein IPH25_04080 [bacterium]|nr:MAG: hypothetical protein IPG37_01075 [bacterium]QQR61625.1 MAG: hypothetical protein IPH25_04080 [bacterium]QQR62815.1 MAG: hypothetical protein IPH67_05405 [bacterium]